MTDEQPQLGMADDFLALMEAVQIIYKFLEVSEDKEDFALIRIQYKVYEWECGHYGVTIELDNDYRELEFCFDNPENAKIFGKAIEHHVSAMLDAAGVTQQHYN